MKTITLALFAATLVFAQSDSSKTTSTDAKKAASAAQDKKTAQSAKPKANDQKPKAPAQPPVQTIPAGAKEVEPNLYRYTDSDGKTWNYRQTPFGINKWEQTSAPAPAPVPQPTPEPTQAKPEPITATDLGDSYRFDKKTPFGHSTWVRKKSELTDQEKALAAAQQASPNASSAATKPAGNQ